MALDTAALKAGLSLMRRLPPNEAATNLSGLQVLRPDLADEFAQRVDTPLQSHLDHATNKRYLVCEYNRDGDSHRSPWSSAYSPPLEDGVQPSAALRELEVTANELLEVYCSLYYTSVAASPHGVASSESGAESSSTSSGGSSSSSNVLSSVYTWDIGQDGSAFGSCWLIRKEIGGAPGRLTNGSWDSIHVVEATAPGAGEGSSGAPSGGLAAGGKWLYKLTSTVLLNLSLKQDGEPGSGNHAAAATIGGMRLAGSVCRQCTSQAALLPDRGHVANIGSMIESMESDIRSALDSLYIAKTKEVVAALHVGGSDGGANTNSAAAAAGSSRSHAFGGVALPGLGSPPHLSHGRGALVGDLKAALAGKIGHGAAPGS